LAKEQFKGNVFGKFGKLASFLSICNFFMNFAKQSRKVVINNVKLTIKMSFSRQNKNKVSHLSYIDRAEFCIIFEDFRIYVTSNIGKLFEIAQVKQCAGDLSMTVINLSVIMADKITNMLINLIKPSQ